MLPSAIRRGLLLAGLAAASTPARAQTQPAAWLAVQSLNAGNVTSNFVNATATDAAGNVYLAGWFNSTLQLGSTTLTAAGNGLFVAKWSPATNSFVWARTAGGVDAQATGLAVSGSSVYVTGVFFQAATFGSLAVSGTGSRELFVAKLTDNGTSASYTWVQHAGNGPEIITPTLALSGSSVYVAGGFDYNSRGNAPLQLGPFSLTSAGGNDAFVAKLTDAGPSASFVWAQRAGGPSDEHVTGLTATPLATTGTVLHLAGDFLNTATFGSTALTSAGNYDAFVAKLTDAGLSASFVWAQRAGGPNDDGAHALAVSGSSVYVAGHASSGAAFGATTLASYGGIDAFVAKLTDAGASASFVWARGAGSAFYDAANSLAVSGSSVFVAGEFWTSPATFGPSRLTSNGQVDVFAAKLTDAGSSASYVWALNAGGLGNDFGHQVLVSPTGSLYVAGQIFGQAQFNSLPAVGYGYPSGGFLALLRDGVLAAAPGASPQPPALAYPNPARGSVRVPVAGPGGPVTLSLLDALGRVVRTQAAAPAAGTPEIVFDLAGVAPGVYALRVAADGAATASRLVVE